MHFGGTRHVDGDHWIIVFTAGFAQSMGEATARMCEMSMVSEMVAG
jgi:hypothetical protein